MPKYRQVFREMLDEHEELFKSFKDLHDRYEKDQDKLQKKYNEQGKAVVELIRSYEARLCGKMERGNNARYSANLSQKFWDEVRAFFPLIDYVGVKWSE